MPGALPTELDHVAVAAERQADLWPRYGGDLAGQWVAGGASPGFRAGQVRFPDPGGRRTMKVEVLEPHSVDESDFLRRYLDRHGPGPHHLTFKVPDLDAALAAVEASGRRPIGVDRSAPDWQEAFLHPAEASGIVVQLAQASGEWESEEPSPLPPPRVAQPAVLSGITHLVADLGAAVSLFRDVLGGSTTERDGDPEVAGTAVDLEWPGGGHLRLVQPVPGSDDAAALGERPGRLRHLTFLVEDPAGVAGTRPLRPGWFEVPPEENHGVRLVLSEPPAVTATHVSAA